MVMFIICVHNPSFIKAFQCFATVGMVTGMAYSNKLQFINGVIVDSRLHVPGTSSKISLESPLLCLSCANATQKYGDSKNAKLEHTGPENAGPNVRAGKCSTRNEGP